LPSFTLYVACLIYTLSLHDALPILYNDGERLLTESIESILKQTYTHFKFVIVNDGSNDATHEIVSKYAEIDERIVYVYRNINKRSEEHTSELQSRFDLVCRLLLEKK